MSKGESGEEQMKRLRLSGATTDPRSALAPGLLCGLWRRGDCFGTLSLVCTGHSALKSWNPEGRGGWQGEGRPPPSPCTWWGSADLGYFLEGLEGVEGGSQGEGNDGGYGSGGHSGTGG